MSKKILVHLRLDKHVHEDLRMISQIDKVSMTNVAESALRQFLVDRKKHHEHRLNVVNLAMRSQG